MFGSFEGYGRRVESVVRGGWCGYDCRKTWVKRNRGGEIVGSVFQFPVVPAYAVTCHKSQGLTLPAAIVHCS